MPGLPHLHRRRPRRPLQVQLPLPQRHHLQPELLHLWLVSLESQENFSDKSIPCPWFKVVQLWLCRGWEPLQHQRRYCFREGRPCRGQLCSSRLWRPGCRWVSCDRGASALLRRGGSPRFLFRFRWRGQSRAVTKWPKARTSTWRPPRTSSPGLKIPYPPKLFPPSCTSDLSWPLSSVFASVFLILEPTLSLTSSAQNHFAINYVYYLFSIFPSLSHKPQDICAIVTANKYQWKYYSGKTQHTLIN